MSESWTTRPLGDLIECLLDHRGRTPKKLGGDWASSGVRVVSAIHIKDGQINWAERERYVTPEMYRAWMPEPLRRGDVLLTSEAPLGEVAQVPSDDDLVLSQRLFALRGRANLLDSTFLRYFLESPRGQEELRRRASGSTVLGIRQSELRKVSVLGPESVSEQRRVASVLSSLDRLIEVDARLLSMAEDGLAALFDQAGFDLDGPTRLDAFVNVNPSYAKPRGAAPYIDMAALSETSAGIQRVMVRQASGGARFTNGDTLMARITPCLENGRIGYVDCLPAGEIGVGSTEFIVLRSAEGVPPAWTYFLARSPRFREYVVRHMSGTSGRQRCPADAVAQYPITMPDPTALAKFESIAAPVFAALPALREEMASVRSVRSELVPMLMSGEVRVSEVAA